MNLTPEQVDQLLKPLNAQRVKRDPRGNDHLESFDVIAHMIRIFGVLGWEQEIDYVMVYEEQHVKDNKRIWDAGYSARCKLTVGEISRQDANFGDAYSQPTRGAAHQLALTSAVSGAMKRAARTLGNQFGLSLYAKGNTTGSVVSHSLAHPTAEERVAEQLNRISNA